MKHSAVWIISLIVVIVGALNWLLVGLAKFDLVAAIAGRRFGEVGPVNATIYTIVGVAGIVLAFSTFAEGSRNEHRRSDTRVIPR